MLGRSCIYLKHFTQGGLWRTELRRHGIQPRGKASLGGREESCQTPFSDAGRASLCAGPMKANSLVHRKIMDFLSHPL